MANAPADVVDLVGDSPLVAVHTAVNTKAPTKAFTEASSEASTGVVKVDR